MQIIACILLVITSLSALTKKHYHAIFNGLFILSLIIGFIAFGFLKGLIYLALLIIGSLIFHTIKITSTINTAAKFNKLTEQNPEKIIEK